jgi:hypothetical protein
MVKFKGGFCCYTPLPSVPARSASRGPCARGPGSTGAGGDGPYFLEQTVSNACGTVALVHAYAALAAAAGGATEAEGWLGRFVSRTAGMTSVERAAALEEDEALAVSHNDMARQVLVCNSEERLQLSWRWS